MKNHELYTHRLTELREGITEEILYQLSKHNDVERIRLTSPIPWAHEVVISEVHLIEGYLRIKLSDPDECFLGFGLLKVSTLIHILEEIEEKRFEII